MVAYGVVMVCGLLSLWGFLFKIVVLLDSLLGGLSVGVLLAWGCNYF